MLGIKDGIRLRSVAAVVAASVALGCGGGGDDGPTGNTGSIQVSVSPATLTLEQGTTGNVTATLTRGGGFTGAVTLAITGLPQGVTPTVTPAQLTGTTTQAQVAVAVAPTVPAGTYTATITATAQGIGSATTTYQLTVTATPDYALSMAAAAITIPAGGNGQATVNINRTNFTGGVTLAVATPPAGIAATFNPNPSTTNASTMTVTVGAGVAPGLYNLTVQGTATAGNRATNLAVTVTAPASFTMVANPNAVTTTPGGSANTSIDITRTNFTGGITLALDNPPAGITATFNPSPTTTNQSTITINVPGTVAPGAYQVTVRGTGTGVDPRTTQITVNVQAPAAGYLLNLSSNAMSVVQGASGQVNIALVRTNFTGAVNLTYEGGTSGITGTITPASTTGNTAVLNFTVPASTAPGIYQLGIRGTATGLTDRVQFLQLTVTAAPSSITLAAQPTALSVTQGQSGNVNLALTRTNFTGAVTFAATNVPAGVTPTFNPNNTTTNASVLNLAVAGGAQTGTFPITITASGTGVTNAVVQVNLTIAAPGGGGNTQFQFCSAAETPIFFAAQDGTGAWQPVSGTTVGSTTTFAFNITQNRGGVMYVHQRQSALRADATMVSRGVSRITMSRALRDQQRAVRSVRNTGSTKAFARGYFVDFYETTVQYASAAELLQLGTDNCTTSQAGKTVTGTVAGVGAEESALLSLGSSFTFFIGALPTNPVTFTDVPPGNLDFIGSRLDDQGDLNRLVVFRNLNVPDGQALPQTIDFAGPASSAPASANLTITNGLGDDLSAFTILTTANNIFSILGAAGDFGGTTTAPWFGLAPAVMIGTDIHGVAVTASPPGSQELDERTVLRYVGAVSNQTIGLGPPIPLPTATQLAAGAYPRFRFQGTLPAEYQKFVDLVLTPQDGNGNYMFISATGAYLAAAGSTNSYDLSVPDVAGLTGFPAASRLTAGGNGLEIDAFGWTGSGIIILQPQVGMEMRSAAKGTALIVP